MMLWRNVLASLASLSPQSRQSWGDALVAARAWLDACDAGEENATAASQVSPETRQRVARLEDLLQALIAGETDWDHVEPKRAKLLALFEAETVSAEVSVAATSQPESPVRKRRRKTKSPAAEQPAMDSPPAPVARAAKHLDLTLLTLFLESHFGEIDRMDGLLLDFENGQSEVLEELRRKVHTFKGELGLLGLGDESTFLHNLEEELEKGGASNEALLHAIRQLRLIWQDLVQASMRDGLYEEAARAANAVSIPSAKVSAPLSEPPVVKPTASPSKPASEKKMLKPGAHTAPMREDEAAFLGDFKAEAAEHFQSLAAFLLDIESDPHNEEAINSIFRVYHSIKGVAGFLNLEPVQVMSHALESLVARARSHLLTLGPSEVTVLLAASDDLKEMVATAFFESGAAHVQVTPGAVEHWAALVALESGERPATPSQPSLESSAPQGVATTADPGLAPQAASTRSDASKAASSAAEDSLRVSAKKLDQLFDALGEIVIAQSMIAGDPVLQTSGRAVDRKELLALKQKIQASQTILNQVQRVTLSLRMVSIKPLFVKMARLARDVSVKTGKGIDFFKEGEETEIDKSFVEKLSDPLVHMIRNSVDHGIESAEERRRLGKAENGRITLRAFQRAGRFYLELSDDGKGLDTEVILRKAIERGLVREGARMEKEAIERLILEPGFSTAQQVTELSGRGVGMDVVRQAIESLGGSLGIQSEKGKGTRFTISLPLTLAIVNGMLVQAGSQYLIVPTLSIVECVNPREGQVQEVGEDGHLLELRGKWLHLLRLTDAMGIAAPPTPFSEGVAVIVEDGLGQSMALFVDALLGGQQVVAKPLGDAVPVPEGVQGGAVGSDGKVRLILDVALLLSRVQAKTLRKENAVP